MNKRFQLFTAFLTFTILITACNVPTGNNGTPPSSHDQIATVVASTLQALTPETDNGETPEPEIPAGLLPHSFYFLGTDTGGLTQVFRLEKDGKTSQQVT